MLERRRRVGDWPPVGAIRTPRCSWKAPSMRSPPSPCPPPTAPAPSSRRPAWPQPASRNASAIDASIRVKSAHSLAPTRIPCNIDSSLLLDNKRDKPPGDAFASSPGEPIDIHARNLIGSIRSGINLCEHAQALGIERILCGYDSDSAGEAAAEALTPAEAEATGLARIIRNVKPPPAAPPDCGRPSQRRRHAPRPWPGPLLMAEDRRHPRHSYETGHQPLIHGARGQIPRRAPGPETSRRVQNPLFWHGH